MTSPHIVIAIPSYKRSDALGVLLGQLNKQQGNSPFAVFILNDGADSDSAQLIEGHKSGRFALHAFTTPKPSGLPMARNRLLDEISKLYGDEPTTVLFLDDDCEVAHTFIEETAKAAKLYDAFTFRVVTVGQSGVVNTYNNKVARRLLKPFVGRAILPLGLLRGGFFMRGDVKKVDHIPGGCFAYRFDLFSQLRFSSAIVGGQSPLDDTFFSFALRKAGAILWFLPHHTVIHRPATSGGVRIKTPKHKWYHYWHHILLLVVTYGKSWYRITAIPVLFLQALWGSILNKTWLFGLLARAYMNRPPLQSLENDLLRVCAPQSGLDPQSRLGGEVYDAQLLGALAQQVDVEIIAPKGAPWVDHGNIWRVTSISPRAGALRYYLQTYRALEQVYSERPFDVIRLHSPYVFGVFTILFRLRHPQVKLWAQYHHYESRPLFVMLTKLFIDRWDYITVPSESTKQQFVENYNVSQKRITVSQPGLTQEVFSANHNRAGSTAQLLFVGQLIQRKNLDFLLEVLAKLPKDLKLIVAGDGPEQDSLTAYARKIGVADRVEFLGRVTAQKKHALMSEAQVLLLPSKQEGFGFVVAEAARHHTPAIVSDRGSLPEVVTDGKTGFVRELKIEDWVDAIVHITNDQSMRERFGREAAEMSAHYSWESAAQQQYSMLTDGGLI